MQPIHILLLLAIVVILYGWYLVIMWFIGQIRGKR